MENPQHLCRSCGKTFKSAQALGGHRRFHKNDLPPRDEGKFSNPHNIHSVLNSAIVSEIKTTADAANVLMRLMVKPQPPDIQIQNTEAAPEPARQFNCRDCHMSFSSYQALGGHRGKHSTRPRARPAPAGQANQDRRRRRIVLDIDLNMPYLLTE